MQTRGAELLGRRAETSQAYRPQLPILFSLTTLARLNINLSLHNRYFGYAFQPCGLV